MKAHTVISTDEDVMAFMDITDAATSDQSMLKGLWARLPAGSCVTFDMGYVNYGAWQELSDHGITYVTREKRRCWERGDGGTSHSRGGQGCRHR